jgi:minor extracellular serine protease Vpr
MPALIRFLFAAEKFHYITRPTDVKRREEYRRQKCLHQKKKIMLTRRVCIAIALVLGAFLPAGSPAAIDRRGGSRDIWAVVLSEPPVVQRLGHPLRAKGRSLGQRASADIAEAQAHAAAVEASQQPIRSAARGMGLRVTGSVRTLLNAVFVQASPEQAGKLRGLPGVSAVVRMRRFKLRLNAAANLINAPAAWNALGGISSAGAGIGIAILDTGIDNTHPAFQDDTLAPPPGFPKGTPDTLPYTNSKIIVARTYLRPAGPIDPATSRPDDYTPRDRAGHGTFLAMIAAGRTVTAPNGPTITGIAPKAYLGNYKVSGATDVNDGPAEEAVLAALDDAASDGMDIVNVSFGSIALFGPNDTGFACSNDPRAICDLVAAAVQNAVNAGIVVVAAAGNDGDIGSAVPTLNTISSPATADDAIAVGASTNSRQLTSTLRAGSGAPSSLQSVPALFGSGPHLSSPLTAPIRSVQDLGDDGTACRPLPPGSLSGALALILRGNCDFVVKVNNAAAAGAVAAVISNSAGDDTLFVMGGLNNAGIPAVMIGNTAGASLRDYIRSAPRPTATIDPQLTPLPTTPDLMAQFSSRGPSIDMEVKPDLVAPGTDIFSATQNLDAGGSEYDATRFTSLGGSSFSTAFVSGAAALVEQRFSNMGSIQVKSALVNTASPNITEGGSQARGTAMGAGRLNAQAAINPGATVEPPTVSFGLLNNTVSLPLSGQLTLTNVGTASDTFRIQVQQRDPDSNAQVGVNGSTSTTVTLGAGQAANLLVRLAGRLPRPGLYEGVITIQGTSGPANLRVPYHYGVQSGIPAGIFAIEGDGLVGTVGQPLPNLLILKLVDSAGLPVPNVNVQFRAAQGGGQIVQADAATDVYGIAAAEANLGPTVGTQTYTATAGGLTLTFNDGARAQPTINAGGAVNGASFASGQAVAPGSILSIFGTNLAEAISSASHIPLPLALSHVSVSFDVPNAGVSVPGYMFFVSPNQLNVQVPWELAGLSSAMMKVRINDSISNIYQLSLSDSAPGIFTYTSGGQTLGVVTHADGSVVTPSKPARAGEPVIVYATGVGPVDQKQASGEAASAQPLANTRQTPSVTVGGQTAAVLFSGLAPFFVGLNQINITVPSGVSSGLQPLVITSNGVASNTVSVPIQ